MSRTANRHRIEYWLGIGRVVIIADFKHGKGVQRREVQLKPEEIIRVGDYLRRAPGPEDYAHMFYHSEHPDLAMPCETCPAGVVPVVDGEILRRACRVAEAARALGAASPKEWKDRSTEFGEALARYCELVPKAD